MAADNPGAAAVAIAVLTAAHAEGNRFDESLILLNNFASEGFALPLDMLWCSGMVMYAEAAIECRTPRCAKSILELLTPWANRLAYTHATSEGPVSHYLSGLAAVLGRYEQADAYFIQAASFNDRIGAKFFAARTELSWGRMLIERNAPGDIDKAQLLLSKAHTVATDNGYGTVARRAAAALHGLD